MKQSHFPQHYCSELLQAFTEGFTEHFIVTATGLLYCLSNPERFYELHEVVISSPISLSIPGTLFKITTMDGRYKGTYIDFEF